jgi:hypothetical protein
LPYKSALSKAVVTITRSVTVAAGVFAPGHLGELTAIVPFELVAAGLEETSAVQRRLRDLPSRVGVYFLLAMCLFPEVGYLLVWDKLVCSLGRRCIPSPSAKALRDLRRRVGAAPMKALFQSVAGPLARPATPGARFGRYRTVSFDGCTSTKVPDTRGNREWLGTGSGGSYPMLELMTLVETGTRALLGAVFGPSAQTETGYAASLLPLLRPDMLVLWDRGFDSNDFTAAVAASGAKFLGRVRSSRRPPVGRRLADGSYLSVIGSVPVRIVQAQITVTCADGTVFTGVYRLATNLLDAGRYPGRALVELYHERWEHESAYYALRHTMLAGRVLRSGDRAGIEQEMWSLLTLYQVVRTAMADATATIPGLDPDRAGFTIAWQAAREQVINAAGVVTDVVDLPGEIGRRILAGLLPARRPRTGTRKVKSPISRYAVRQPDGRPPTSQKITAIAIDLNEPPQLPAPAPPPAGRPRTRLGRLRSIQELMHTDPTGHWAAADIANHLGLDPHNTRTQLLRWSRQGLFRKTERATYTLP